MADVRDADGPLALLIDAALAEDVGDGDRTTHWTVEEGARARAGIVAREPLVVAGAGVVVAVFRALDPAVKVEILHPDGARVGEDTVVLRLAGPTRAILTGERVALNFLAHLSGVATLTRRFVEAVEGSGARITDTRKTTPGWRRLEKDAVRAGGGMNHRMGLHDMVLVKENHIAVAGGVVEALERVHARNREGLSVVVEVERPDELEALEGAGVDRILLDNMSLDELRRAVRRVRAWGEPQPDLEASGNMTLARVQAVAELGVEWISVGALTHSAPAVDFSLLMDA